MSSSSQDLSQKKRPSHHVNDTATLFQNHGPSAGAPTWAELANLSFPLNWYSTDPAHSHRRQVKVVKPDWGEQLIKSRPQNETIPEYLLASWLGHAGVMVEFPSLNTSSKLGATTSKQSVFAIFDPIFSMRAGPTQYTSPARLRESPCQVEDLPGCNVVFISHNHYDHLDLSTVLELLKRFPDTKWFVPLGNKAWFIASGAKTENVVEMDWWETWEGNFPLTIDSDTKNELSSFKISCVPAQHTSGRTGWDQGSTLWSGWVIERFIIHDTKELKIRKGSVYHAGDTGYRRIAGSLDVNPAFKEIGEKLDTIDVSFIPIWRGGSLGFISYTGLRLMHQHMPSALHCSPEDAIAIHKDVKSKNTVAVHFGTFVGSELESQEAVEEFYKACDDSNVKDLENKEVNENGRAGTIDIGESIIIDIE